MSHILQDIIQLEEIDAELDSIFAEGKQMTAVENKGMDDEELLAVIEGESSQAHGAYDSELSGDRERAMNYYLNRARGDEVAGRSQVQTSDVMDVIEWVLPDVIEAFTTNEEAVLFQPVNTQDKKEALIETRYINHVFYNDTEGYLFLYEWFKDALMLKNGVAKVYRCKEYEMEYNEYSELTEVELMEVLEDDDYEVEVLNLTPTEHNLSGFTEELQQQYYNLPSVQQQVQGIMSEARAYAMDAMGKASQAVITQEEMLMIQQLTQESAMEALQELTVTLYDVHIRCFKANEKSTAEAIPPEEFEINEDHTSLNCDKARYTAHRTLMSRSELIEMGYDPDLIEDIMAEDFIEDSEDLARKYHTLNDYSGNTFDPSTEKVRVRDVYMRVDYDGDGIAELRHIFVAGDTILENEYADENPYVTISPIIMPHRWVGISLYDRIKQIQDIGTSVWRQLLDNLYRMNNARTIVVENQVNMDDLLSSRAGGTVRAKSTDAVAPFPHMPIGVEAYQMLQQLSRTRMERSGVGPEMMAEGMVIDNDTAHGVERLMSAKEKLVGMIIKNFGETGVARVFTKLHALERKHQDKPRQIEVNGTFIEFEPWRFKRRNRARVKVGLGAGDKQKLAMAIESVLAKQEKLLNAGYGGILVDDTNIYNALTDAVRFQGLQNANDYYKDPTTPEAQQAKEAKAKQAQEPTIEEKVLMLTQQLEGAKNQINNIKEGQRILKEQNEQERKWTKDKDESAREWTKLEIEANKDLGPEGRYQ